MALPIGSVVQTVGSPSLGRQLVEVIDALSIASSATTGTTHNITLTPTAALESEAVWHGIHIDGAALDPSGTGADITGLEVDLSGVDTTNDPVLHGVEITVPVKKDAMHIHEGQLVINNTPSSASTTEFHANDVRVDLEALDSTSAWSALAVTAVGATSGSVDALLARNLVGVVRQETAAFTSPSQTEFAGRKTGGGATYVDGIDTEAIFVADNDEVLIGSSSQFSQIEVIMGTTATKDVVPTFWYSTGASTWTQFFPDDLTSGFQNSSLITWVPDSISGSWTGDGDPGGADSTAGYWIRIIRTRNGNVGSPSPTTMKTTTVVTYTWDSEGQLTAKCFNVLQLNDIPSSASDTGTIGEIRITAAHIYVCSATDTWVRTELATW
jgi:hypothetical protein